MQSVRNEANGQGNRVTLQDCNAFALDVHQFRSWSAHALADDEFVYIHNNSTAQRSYSMCETILAWRVIGQS